MPELVVDADGHTYEPDDLWVERMDAKRWGDWIPRKVVEDEVYETFYLGGRVRGGGRELQDKRAAAVGMIFLGDAVSAAKLVSIALILVSVIGLNLSGVTP